MGISLVFRIILLTLSVLSIEVSGFRNGRRIHPHAHNPQKEFIDYQSSHEHLLGGAGCEVPMPPQIKAPKRNIWARLSISEGLQVIKWLERQPALDLGRKSKNYVDDVSFMIPNKTDVLQYLDHDGPEPVRYASVSLEYSKYYNPSATPNFTYILVGPLPISNATTYQPLTYPFTKKTPLRNLWGDQDYRKYANFNQNITNSVKNITDDLWNTTSRHYSAYSGQDPYWQYNDRITEWNEYWGYSTGEFDSEDLLPLGLFYGAEYDLWGNDPSSWKFKGWYYNGIHYNTTEDFTRAYYSPGFEKLPPNTDGRWTHTNQKGAVLPLDTQAAPMPIAKNARFSLDWENKYVEWMGFSFYITIRPEVGLTLYDIRFKGERIIYELGIQEALAHYAGSDPVQSGTSYQDSAYGLGDANELMPGYDCPTYATYMNMTIVGGYIPKLVKAICLFEYDADYPIQRHGYQSNTKNIYFVVRTVTTVGNYDYMFSYEFYYDGSIQVSVRAAGYIQSAYFAKNEDYGYHIHDALSGSLHSHVLNFKADFDILGTANTMELVTVTPTTESYPWSDQPRNTMKLVRKQIESEDESRLMWSGNGATQYRIVNTDKPNKYGEYRGYRILPSQGTVHLAIHNSSNLGAIANYAYHDLQITKQKDTEPRSTNPLNGNDVYNPLIDFNDFFDGESLQQEDLVLWFNLGVHHLPHTGDLPNTVYTTAHSAIQITPSNYFLYDQSRDTVNMVRLDYDYKSGNSSVETFGQAPQICMANLSSLAGAY